MELQFIPGKGGTEQAQAAQSRQADGATTPEPDTPPEAKPEPQEDAP